MHSFQYFLRRIIISFEILIFPLGYCWCQDLPLHNLKVELNQAEASDSFFICSRTWRGADGAASIDLGKGRVLWLFSDTFISKDSAGSRENAVMIRNSIAIQKGYRMSAVKPGFYWKQKDGKPDDFFKGKDNYWYWTGHGSMVKDRLLIFLMKVNAVSGGLGFEVSGWAAALVSNPAETPDHWKFRIIEGQNTFGLVAGSAAVLTDAKWLYAYGAVEPASHEVYLLRWPLEAAYRGNLEEPDWWSNDHWAKRTLQRSAPQPLFIGATEFSVHYDKTIRKYVQVQSFGFGEASIGIRVANRPEGSWSEPLIFHKPELDGIRQPFVYAAKAHPEQKGDGLCITYNVNSFDFGEVLKNQSIYFPKTIWVQLGKR
jgi:hypothetical protein